MLLRPQIFASIFALAACATASAQIAPLPMALCAGWEGERVCEQLHEDAQIRVLRCTFPPGVGHDMHYHPPHFGYVVSGESVMRITTAAGVRETPVRTGGSFSNDAEIQHAALNIGAETTTYLIVEKKYADVRAPEAVAPGLCAH
ncbi:cupin domain-containing protein [Terricaulis silvestris]|uniref:Thermophilic glucose-6-phosphate isomerase n=1 Tax=Terricaulis silvestris TaxID=2686094 RepID=A0A6I6MJ24_9CAUL|nr:cupin domain-containing protein [Terricaulis silvestris]QGZ94619.1 Thermophilic glucose-6-phosphate isomerase [Terricaulis silvestris]